MKRSRPVQHSRRLPSGKTITVNKGVKRRRVYKPKDKNKALAELKKIKDRLSKITYADVEADPYIDRAKNELNRSIRLLGVNKAGDAYDRDVDYSLRSAYQYNKTPAMRSLMNDYQKLDECESEEDC